MGPGAPGALPARRLLGKSAPPLQRVVGLGDVDPVLLWVAGLSDVDGALRPVVNHGGEAGAAAMVCGMAGVVLCGVIFYFLDVNSIYLTI